jgi:Fe-S cluster biogenesis protein NfuA
MQLYTEITPNPATLKFISDRTFIPDGTADFPDSSTADNSLMAKKLFQFRFVKSVFIGRNFITVTKEEEFKWEELIPVIKDAIRAFIESGQAVVEKISSGGNTASADDSDVVRKIKQLIDENVRPAVAMDGGDIVFEGFDEGIVKLKMMGACSGCPSSTATLKAGIQGLLTRMVPEVKEVQSV